MEVIQWLASNFFGIPAILLGFIVLLGLILQKKIAVKLSAALLKQ